MAHTLQQHYKEKNRKRLTIIGAYISVRKGSKFGDDTVHTQQMFIYEKEAMRTNSAILNPGPCPRKGAIQALSNLISDLQTNDHGIILCLDANQSTSDCYRGDRVMDHTIEWLRLEHGLSDPFIQLMGRRPNSTTTQPNRDIDYVFTYGIEACHITTLGLNNPAHSDHLGIGIDIDIASYFNGTYSSISSFPTRKLTSGNPRAVEKHLAYAKDQLKIHNISQRIQELDDISLQSEFTDYHEDLLNTIDDQVTEIILSGERQCTKQKIN